MGVLAVLGAVADVGLGDRVPGGLGGHLLGPKAADARLDDGLHLRSVQRCLLPCLHAAGMGAESRLVPAHDVYLRGDEVDLERGSFSLGICRDEPDAEHSLPMRKHRHLLLVLREKPQQRAGQV